MEVLVTGGAGYIGSHTVLELLKNGHEVIILDNLKNSKKGAVKALEKISRKKILFYEMDLLNKAGLERIFLENRIDAVIHFAAFKAVGESVANPLDYYENNLISTLNLLEVMNRFHVKNLIFSSSAAVYGAFNKVPFKEEMPLGAVNPYGYTKLMIEQILQDTYRADPNWSIDILRYFNPIGAHESGEIGEDPGDEPNNLMPIITQVAIGKLERLNIYGNNYPTKDGTGVRDYIHVVDLAKGHVAALENRRNERSIRVYNLGTGEGYSVMDVLNNFLKATGIRVKYAICGNRVGDLAIAYADVSKAYKELGWKAEKNLENMCCDSWHWKQKHPNGYL